MNNEDEFYDAVTGEGMKTFNMPQESHQDSGIAIVIFFILGSSGLNICMGLWLANS